MKGIYRFVLAAVLLAGLFSLPASGRVENALAAGTDCVASPNGSTYTATVCITSPVDGTTLSGDGTITATVNVTGTNPGIRRLVFYLDSTYILTDYYTPFTFVLPTNRFLDGTYTLSVEAVMKDNFTTARASITVTLNNGNTSSVPTNGNTFSPATGTNPAAGQPFVVAAAGDGAGGEPNAATVTNLISGMNPNLFLYIGDVYEKGSIAEFYNWYAPSTYFGRFKSISDPTSGNHDYILGNDDPYRYYWDNAPDYYSFNSHGWHFISLNSYDQLGFSIGAGSPEYTWLQSDLAANTSPCTLAFYHHPYLSIGQEGGRPSVGDIWKLLALNNVSIILNGHDHEYQRWIPLDGNGNFSSNGMTEFIIGTGGHSLEALTSTDSRVAYATDANPLGYGALKLELHANYAIFRYMSITGSTIDSGIIPCKGAGATPLPKLYLPLIHS